MRSRRPTLLLVEDNGTLRRTLYRHIDQRLSVDLVEAIHGNQAIQLAARCQPDVILLDPSLPDYSPLALIARLSSTMPATRIVVMVGYGQRDFREQMLSSGAWACIAKEALGSELEPTLRRALCAADLFARVGLDRSESPSGPLQVALEGLAAGWTRIGDGLHWLDVHGPWAGRPRTRLLYLANVLELALVFALKHKSLGL